MLIVKASDNAGLIKELPELIVIIVYDYMII